MQPGAGAEWAQQFEKNGCAHFLPVISLHFLVYFYEVEEEEWEQKWNDRMQSNWASQFTDGALFWLQSFLIGQKMMRIL